MTFETDIRKIQTSRQRRIRQLRSDGVPSEPLGLQLAVESLASTLSTSAEIAIFDRVVAIQLAGRWNSGRWFIFATSEVGHVCSVWSAYRSSGRQGLYLVQPAPGCTEFVWDSDQRVYRLDGVPLQDVGGWASCPIPRTQRGHWPHKETP